MNLGAWLLVALLTTPAATAGDRLIAPAVGEPVPSGVGLATYCDGDPATATWRAWNETLADDQVRNGPDGSNSCYLPWLGPSELTLAPYSAADGYVNLNLQDIWCGETPFAAEETAFQHPSFLYVKLPPEPRRIANRGYMISVRVLQGTAFPTSAEETRDAHWGTWQKIRAEDLGPEGKVIALPFGELKVGDATWFQIQFYLLDGDRTYRERVVDFVSPIDC